MYPPIPFDCLPVLLVELVHVRAVEVQVGIRGGAAHAARLRGAIRAQARREVLHAVGEEKLRQEGVPEHVPAFLQEQKQSVLLRHVSARKDSNEPYSCSNFTKASKIETSGFSTLNARSNTTLVFPTSPRDIK